MKAIYFDGFFIGVALRYRKKYMRPHRPKPHQKKSPPPHPCRRPNDIFKHPREMTLIGKTAAECDLFQRHALRQIGMRVLSS
jgi:hypothetical protein